MKAIPITWITLGALYAAFFSWYTSFGGPLTSAEIDHYLTLFEQSGDRNGDPQRLAQLRAFMESDTGDDFAMFNVIDMYDQPLPVEGVAPSESSDEVLGRYMQYMFPALFRRACHPVFVGEAAAPSLELMNAQGMERWTRGAAMRYRSRRDMLEIITNPAFSGSHDFKIAAMAKTFAFPLDPWYQAGDPRLLLALLFAIIGCALSWRISGRG